MTDKLEKYLPEHWAPEAVPISTCYGEAQVELVSPFPSVPLTLFPQLNAMMGGFRAYEFTILCGATGSGKTTLCANLSRDLLEQGVPQFVASVETGHTDYVKRIISSIAGYDWNSGELVAPLKLHIFNEQHGTKFAADSIWLSLYDNRTSVENLMADIAFMVKNNGIKIAFIDNLNFFLEITSAQNSLVEMDRVIHELIIFCKQVPVHIVMVMHPKKTDHGRVESEFDVKGSSTAVQEAHNVLLLNRAHPDLVKSGLASEWDREITIAKMRRRGKYVRRKVIIKAKNGVQYFEGEIV